MILLRLRQQQGNNTAINPVGQQPQPRHGRAASSGEAPRFSFIRFYRSTAGRQYDATTTISLELTIFSTSVTTIRRPTRQASLSAPAELRLWHPF
jgi:hypothetical protein